MQRDSPSSILYISFLFVFSYFLQICLAVYVTVAEKMTTKFWKPAHVERSSDNEIISGTKVPINATSLLPIAKHRLEILYALEEYQAVILVGETGSGKTTQILQYLYQAGWAGNKKQVVCTQPRTLAVIRVAKRVSEEMNSNCDTNVNVETNNNIVGFKVRFDNNTTDATLLTYCTDGILLREIMTDPCLSKYSVIVIDEAHERSLNSDTLIGLLKQIMRKRKDLRVVISSATLDATRFKDFFNFNISNPDCKSTSIAIKISGRMFPVDIQYLSESTCNYLMCTVETVLAIHEREGPGDILVFLPGSEEIHSALNMLEVQYTREDLIGLPLYAGLSMKAQEKVFYKPPHGCRKVIFATNVAETSITIEGIRFVVDSGLAKEKYFDTQSGSEYLMCTSISQDRAQQRCGRAGRSAAGKCFRLYTAQSYQELQQRKLPDMQRLDISSTILQVKALGVKDILHFDYISSPPVALMLHALDQLYGLGALDEEGDITNTGSCMAVMPITPAWSRVLLASLELGCTEEALNVAAMCCVTSPFTPLRPGTGNDAKRQHNENFSHFAHPSGDHMTLSNVLEAFLTDGYHGKKNQWCLEHGLEKRVLLKAVEIRKQLRRILQRIKPKDMSITSCDDEYSRLLKALTIGFFMNVAQLGNDGTYLTIQGQRRVELHPASALHSFAVAPEWVVFHDMMHSNNAQSQRQSQGCQIRDVSTIDPKWLLTSMGHVYRTETKLAKFKK